MKERLINHQQKPRPFGMKTRRLNAVTRILMVLFAMMLIPQGTWAQVDYYMYDTSTGSFTKMTADAGSYTTITDGGISGTSLINTSRNTPPAAPVIVPMIMAAQNG